MVLEPDVYAMVLRLQPERNQPPLVVNGHSVHGMFLELVRQVDPELSNALHQPALSKHFTVAALPPYGVRLPLEVRVTLLRSDLFAPFARALLEQTVRPALRLGRTSLLLTEVLATAGSHALAGFGSFAELAAGVQPARNVRLRFVTPTFTTQGRLGQGNKQRLNLLPLPEAMFGSLVRRWNDLAPEGLGVDREAVVAMCGDVLVKQYRMETEAHRLRMNVQIGFVGHCTYELPDSADVRRTLALLADAAFYLGVGAKTTQGMGVCRREAVPSQAVDG